jgi:saccharopine dehydrogenase-like NADP-dependent oxidoreductase
VEHEEVLLVPRWVKTKRATFKYGLGDDFIRVLKTIKMLGLDNKEPVCVKGVWVAPRDVVAACLPDPAHLGDRMFGKTCAGTWVKGMKDGKPYYHHWQQMLPLYEEELAQFQQRMVDLDK